MLWLFHELILQYVHTHTHMHTVAYIISSSIQNKVSVNLDGESGW